MKAACLELGHEETSNGHVERKYTQGKALLFKTVKVMKDQESLRNLRLKKTRRHKKKCNYDPGLDSEPGGETRHCQES